MTKTNKGGRPTIGKSNRVPVNITIDPDLLKKVREAGVNLSELINSYLKKWRP